MTGAEVTLAVVAVLGLLLVGTLSYALGARDVARLRNEHDREAARLRQANQNLQRRLREWERWWADREERMSNDQPRGSSGGNHD